MRKVILFICLLMLIPLALKSQFREPSRGENEIRFKETHTLKSPKGILEDGEGYQGAVREASFSPDGKILANGYGILSGEDTIILWDPHTGKPIRTLIGHTGAVNTVCFSPDGKMIASASRWDKTIRLWDPHTGKPIRTITMSDVRKSYLVSFSPDGKMLASASQDLGGRTFIQLWNPHTGKLIREFTDRKDKRLFSNCFSPDGQMLASVSYDETIRLWNPYTGRIIRTLAGHDRNEEISSVNFSPDGKMIASTSEGKTIKLWDPHTGKLITTLTENGGQVSAATFSPDGKMIASVNYNNTVKLWNPYTGKLITTLTGKQNELSSVIFSPDGEMIAAWSVYAATTTLWSTDNLKTTKTPEQQEEAQSGSKPYNDNTAGIVLYPPGQQEIEQSGSRPRNDNTAGIVLDPSGQQVVGEDADKPNKIDGMVRIPAGEFRMGTDEKPSPDVKKVFSYTSHGRSKPYYYPSGGYKDVHDNEKPVHTVYLDVFYIDTYEVTNAQYKEFVDANPEWSKTNIDERFHDGDYLRLWEGNTYPKWAANHPVVYVSWYAAMAYAEWAGKRLPTEAEWEKAARGGLIGKAYPWGNSIDASKANYQMNFASTLPVGTYAPNNYGLYDISGNVWEWCLDEYDPDFYKNSPPRNPIADANANSIAGVLANAKMAPRENLRQFRGGSFRTNPLDVRVSLRAGGPPVCTISGLGFRCVRDTRDSKKDEERDPIGGGLRRNTLP